MNPERIILHCSATADSGTLSWDNIRRFHTDTNGWSDIGYHYGIELYGSTYVFLQGRHPSVEGAHCRAAGRNHDSLGLCVVGEYDAVPPAQTLYRTTVDMLTFLCFTFHIPATQVHGHREFESMKTCPGLMWDLERLRQDIDIALQSKADGEIYLPLTIG